MHNKNITRKTKLTYRKCLEVIQNFQANAQVLLKKYGIFIYLAANAQWNLSPQMPYEKSYVQKPGLIPTQSLL